MRQVEGQLKRYSGHLVAAGLGAIGIFFRDHIVGLLGRVPSEMLPIVVFWLALGAVLFSLLLVFYWYKCSVLEKEILKVDPHYYEHKEFDEAFRDATKEP